MMVEMNGGGSGESGKNNIPGAAPGGAKKKRKSAPRMAPVLSRRSIIGLTIGLVLGVGLGIGYWILSPAISELTSSVQEVSTQSSEGPFESTSSIQMVRPGTEYVTVKELQYQGEYYAAKANTLPFFEFLEQELVKQVPDYAHTVEELYDMITIRYDWNSDNTGNIEIRVVASSDQEALYIAGFVPHAFQSFLIEEENTIEKREYENTLASIEAIKLLLFDAEKELADVILVGDVYNLDSDPEYVALQATIASLELELANQAAELALLIALDDTTEAYLESIAVVERTSIALAEARENLITLSAENSIEHYTENREYNVAEAKIDNLNRQLSDLNTRLSQFFTTGSEESGVVDYLVAGTATQPITVPPERLRGRNTAMIGGICGLGVAWVTINRKWLVNQLSSSGADEDDEGIGNEV